VSVVVEEDVFGFEVAVDDVEIVEVVEGEGDFCSVEFGDWIWKSLGRFVVELRSEGGKAERSVRSIDGEG
jgi:hypothetical protein